MIITQGLSIKGGVQFYPASPPPIQYLDMIERLLLYYPTPLSSVNLPNSVTPRGTAISSDGTKFFAMNDQEQVFEYDLSTPFDISTISYNSITTTLSEMGGTGRGMCISSNGTKLYGITTNDIIHQYSLGTAWDLTSISYDSKSFNLNGYDTLAVCIVVSGDGSKLYYGGDTTDTIYQFSLSTPFDIGSVTYDNVSINMSSLWGETSLDTFAFNSDGTKFYVYGSEKDDLVEFFLSTAWDLDTAVLTGHWMDYDTISSPVALTISPQNNYMYINQATPEIFPVKLGTGNLAHFVNRTYNFTESSTDSTYALCVSRDGTLVFRGVGSNVYKYVTPNAWVFSELTLANTYATTSLTSEITTSIKQIFFSDTGEKAYFFGTSPSTKIVEFTLGTPYDFSNVLSNLTVNFGGTGLRLGAIPFYGPGFITPDGHRIFLPMDDFINNRGAIIQQMYMANAFDLSSMTESSNVAMPSGISLDNTVSFWTNPEGGRFYITDRSNETIRSFYITNRENPWDITKYSADSFYNYSTYENSLYYMSYQHYGNIILAIGNFDNMIAMDLANNYTS